MAAWRTRPAEGAQARRTGQEAEALAASWLEARGFRILARNHVTRRGEIDLICQEGETLCFAEVRSRSRLDYGSPAASVTPSKARRVVAAAADWVARNGAGQRTMRFDVISVLLAPEGPQVELFRNAFDAGGLPWP